MKKNQILFITCCLCFFSSLGIGIARSASIKDSDIKTFEFNGLKLGSSLVSLKHRFPEFECIKDRVKADQQTCKALMNFNRRPGVINSSQSNVSLTYRNKQLTKINVVWFPSMFKKTVSDFKKYYGKPSKVAVETLTSNEGDTLENTQYYWLHGRESIEYQQYTTGENLSNITFSLLRIDESAKNKNIETIVTWNDIAGKTVKGKDFIKEFGFKDYFSKNGKLVEVRENGGRHRGKWTISNSGYLCLVWKDSNDCGQLKVNSDGSISFMRYDKVIRKYERFKYGNQ